VPRVVAALIATLGLTTGCLDQPTGPPTQVRLDLSQPWLVAAPREVRMDAQVLAAAAVQAAGMPRVRCLLVARDGRLVFERYFAGTGPGTLFDVRSVTKSVTGALTGLALTEGALAGLDAPIAPELPPPDTLDAVDSTLTVRELLTMTSGFQWDEETGPDYNLWIVSSDHVQYLLDRPYAHPPGTVFTYNSAAVHTLGVVVQRATGIPLPTYAQNRLFGPLGVDTVAWEVLERGTVNGGSGIALRARDLLKVGQLFLQHGWSGDRSIVPEAWVALVTRPQFTWRTSIGPLTRVTYGMLWWVSDADPAAFFAWGYGGQFIYVVPSLDLVVVATTDWSALTETTPQVLAAQVLGVIVGGVQRAAF
jgi:CubicO group peptidase (beta-lactamase class C family)